MIVSYYLGKTTQRDTVSLDKNANLDIQKTVRHTDKEMICKILFYLGSLEVIVQDKDSLEVFVDGANCRGMLQMSRNAVIKGSVKSVEYNLNRAQQNVFFNGIRANRDKFDLAKIDKELYETVQDSLLKKQMMHIKEKIFASESLLCLNSYFIHLRFLDAHYRFYKYRASIADSIEIWHGYKEKQVPKIKKFESAFYKIDISDLNKNIAHLLAYDSNDKLSQIDFEKKDWNLLKFIDINKAKSDSSYNTTINDINVITVLVNHDKNTKKYEVNQINLKTDRYFLEGDVLELAKKQLNLQKILYALLVNSKGEVIAINPPSELLKSIIDKIEKIRANK